MAIPLYLQVINHFNQELLSLNTDLARQLSRVWGDIGKSIFDDLQKLAEEIAANPDDSYEARLKKSRYAKLMEQVQAKIATIQANTLESLADESQRKAAVIGQYYAKSSVGAIQGRFTPPNIALSYSRLNTQAPELSCAEALQANLQSLTINTMMAAWSMEMLHRLLMGTLDYSRVDVNLEDGVARVQRITR